MTATTLPTNPLSLGTKVRLLPPFDTLTGVSDFEVAGVQFVEPDGEICEGPTERWQYLIAGLGDGEMTAFAAEFVEPI